MDKQEFKYLCANISILDTTHDADAAMIKLAERFDPELTRKAMAYVNARREMCEYVRSRTGDRS